MRFSWRGWSFCQLFLAGQHVNQRRFSNIRATNKRKFWFSIRRTKFVVIVAYNKCCGFDIHGKIFGKGTDKLCCCKCWLVATSHPFLEKVKKPPTIKVKYQPLQRAKNLQLIKDVRPCWMLFSIFKFQIGTFEFGRENRGFWREIAKSNFTWLIWYKHFKNQINVFFTHH